MPPLVFLLSPAQCGGKRSDLLLSPRASFSLARRLRSPAGAPLGEVFSFLSGLYFRGKLAYAETFAEPPPGWPGALVITPNRGLMPAAQPLRTEGLRAFSRVDVDPAEPRYREPLILHARLLEEALAPDGVAVLLGSVATGKYVEILAEPLRGRLRFPSEFVGRGDMSRGGLLLRCVREGRQLTYVPVPGATRRGRRPPRLERLAAARKRKGET